jgi:acyl-coenzyme A thioesterase PaaI-like protein
MSANILRKLAGKLSPNVIRRLGNLYLPYMGAAIKTTRVTDDYLQLDVQMRLTWFNKNYVGTQFGGSLYSMTDPFYMLMLMNNLGREYIVWDKSAQINFVKPGRGTVFAYFRLTQEKILEIKNKADTETKYIFDLPVDIVDQNNELIAQVIKTLYVRKK